MKHFRLFLMAAALFTCTTTVDAQTLRNSSGNAIGKIESDGTVRDKSGNRVGQITSSGEIRSSSGNTIGKIDNDGTVRNGSNSCIGYAKGVKKEYAAVYFFFNFFK